MRYGAGMEIDAVIAWLKSHDTPGLQALAGECGVPFHTLRKIASGETKNPGVFTLLPIVDRWRKTVKSAA